MYVCIYVHLCVYVDTYIYISNVIYIYMCVCMYVLDRHVSPKSCRNEFDLWAAITCMLKDSCLIWMGRDTANANPVYAPHRSEVCSCCILPTLRPLESLCHSVENDKVNLTTLQEKQALTATSALHLRYYCTTIVLHICTFMCASRLRVCICIYIYIYIHTCTCMHTYIRTYIHQLYMHEHMKLNFWNPEELARGRSGPDTAQAEGLRRAGPDRHGVAVLSFGDSRSRLTGARGS